MSKKGLLTPIELLESFKHIWITCLFQGGESLTTWRARRANIRLLVPCQRYGLISWMRCMQVFLDTTHLWLLRVSTCLIRIELLFYNASELPFEHQRPFIVVSWCFLINVLQIQFIHIHSQRGKLLLESLVRGPWQPSLSLTLTTSIRNEQNWPADRMSLLVATGSFAHVPTWPISFQFDVVNSL